MTLRSGDRLTLVYATAVATLLCLAGVHRWWPYIAVCVGVGALVVAVTRYLPARFTFLRTTYPLVVAFVMYQLTGRLTPAIYGHAFDASMVRLESAVLGFHPNLVLDRLASRPLSELLMTAYLSFYFLLAVPPVVLGIRRQWTELERFVTVVLGALFTCYVGFVLVPVLGPASVLHFATPAIQGYVVVPLQQFIMAHGDPPGTCFPSAHVAASWCAIWALRGVVPLRAYRALLALGVTVTVAVVYTRYHFVLDAVAGLAVAGAVTRARTVRVRRPALAVQL